ncbi:unnamed protein product [Spirodela intermedia]|uniref:Reverse transcriptase Ty1/copia-type domain-containing protein n=1 Tax=Spirodela intermedia TaxID=51605 RepID=A0A7I8IPH4_SPIIN|nr:unnamed protein product [Spirodela intermedia]CAA6659807.1 unnamed protein product [Spirodela intermedia]
MQEITYLQKQLIAVFDIKVLGQLKYFLGIEVAYYCGNLFLSERKYITDLLKYTGMSNYKPTCTPIEAKHCIEASKESDQVDKELDIAYSIGVLSQYMHDPMEVYCCLIGGNLVTWRSQKQKVVARSSAELADILTKGISASEFCNQRSKLGMNNIHTPT